MTTTAIPRYGIVEWLDAVGVRDKVIPEKAKKKLPRRRSIGELFVSADGTLLILHEYDADKGFQTAVEATIIPAGWAQKVIALTPPDDTPKKVEGTDAVHQS
jgi:hypothetical protein